jgi:ubiquinone/menaquinone biosynthesis C-methylase UbiE
VPKKRSGGMGFEELKERHAVMWGSAPFERIAETLAEMHEAVVTAVAAKPGEPWLDVGCGTGELAFMAAETGAEVIGCDLSPVLVGTARRQAAERGLEITFEVGDAEALQFGDASFDVVSSTVGAIFAPNHEAVAAELARVTRPGGRLGMTAWSSGGEVDRFFEIIGSYAPPPPAGAGVAASWGEQSHVESLLGQSFDLTITQRDTPWQAESAEEMWTELSEAFGPIKTLIGALPPDRAESFKRELLEFFASEQTEQGLEMSRPYLLILGIRKD